MIKFVMAAVWIAAVTVGSVYYSFNNSSKAAGETSEPSFFGGLDYVRTEMISVPLLRGGTVYGYFLARLVFTVEPAELKKISLPVEVLLMDQVYSYLYANPQINFVDREDLDLDMLRNGIRDDVNARLGQKLVHDVLVEQLDFLTKDDIRDNTIRRRAGAVGAAIKHEAAAEALKDGH